METIVSSPMDFQFESQSEIQPESTESEDILPENLNCDQPISKEPNDVYKGLCQGFTLVFDSKTMLKPKSQVSTPTTPSPTTPTRRHQRTFSVTSNKNWTDSLDSSVVTLQGNGARTEAEKLLQNIELKLQNEISLLDNIKTPSKTESIENFQNEPTGKENSSKNSENIKNKEIAIENQGEISKTFVKQNLQSATNGNLRNGNHKKSSESFILHDVPQPPRWKTVAIFLYFHLTAAIGIFLVLSSQVMWQTIAFTLGMHVLSAFGVSVNFIKRFIPELFNIKLIYEVLSSFVIPTAIPWIMWEENILSSFLVVAQIGHCLHWYGSWFSSREEKVKTH